MKDDTQKKVDSEIIDIVKKVIRKRIENGGIDRNKDEVVDICEAVMGAMKNDTKKDWEIIGKKGYTVQVLQYGRVFNTTKETAKHWLDNIGNSQWK